MMLLIDEKFRDQLLVYLQTRPLGEVFNAYVQLQALQPEKTDDVQA